MTRTVRPYLQVLMSASMIVLGMPAQAQTALDRADPSLLRRTLPMPDPQPDSPPPSTLPRVNDPRLPDDGRVVATTRAIMVEGNDAVPSAAFAPAIASFAGRYLDTTRLAELAAAVAGVARSRGYPLATAWVEPQPPDAGTLRVTLDEGRVDAVRVLGATEPQADRLLAAALVGHEAVRRRDLDRAIALVGELPGVRVKSSRYVREHGFGILLVEIVADRASGYVQLDNRGSREVGPVRATALASVRGLATSGDELALVAASTPFEPSEFAFARVRYGAPVDASGSVLWAAASYGRVRPGAGLKPLDVAGDSYDVSVAYSRALRSSREGSLQGVVELRTLRSQQSLLGFDLRDDRITTLTGTLAGTSRLGPGAFRGEAVLVGGLPVANATRAGSPKGSRMDGDARFATLGYAFEWTAPVAGRFGVALASAGQVASRPLLAAAEIGAGGPVFGRAYDPAERTGDDGVLGSVELRADAGTVLPGIVDRLQLYGFVDGAHVENLRGGEGGGSLLSTGTGARLGIAGFDGAVEVAFPLNADRFDTGDRSPRVSLRLARGF